MLEINIKKPMNHASLSYMYTDNNGNERGWHGLNLLHLWLDWASRKPILGAADDAIVTGEIIVEDEKACVGPIPFGELMQAIRPIVGFTEDDDMLSVVKADGEVETLYYFSEKAARDAGAEFTFRAIGVCSKCGAPLFRSANHEYISQCFECESDFFEFEQDTPRPELNKVVYVYHEHFEGNAYGEQIIRVFQSEETGRKFLRERVEKVYATTWEDFLSEGTLCGDVGNAVTDDYVCIKYGDGNCAFFVLDSKEVEE